MLASLLSCLTWVVLSCLAWVVLSCLEWVVLSCLEWVVLSYLTWVVLSCLEWVVLSCLEWVVLSCLAWVVLTDHHWFCCWNANQHIRRDRLVGLMVKAPASRTEDPGFESRLRRDFSGVESYQSLKNRHSSGYPARRPAL